MNSSTAARNGDGEDEPFRLRKSTSCLTDSCSSGVSELMTAARFSAAMFAFYPQYSSPKKDRLQACGVPNGEGWFYSCRPHGSYPALYALTVRGSQLFPTAA